MTVSLVEDAQRCFTNAFDAVIIIICTPDTVRKTQSHSPNQDPSPSYNDDIIFIDGTKNPPSIKSYASKDAPALPDAGSDKSAGICTWHAARSTLKSIFDNSRTFSSTFISGRLTISGDMAVMARLNIHQ